MAAFVAAHTHIHDEQAKTPCPNSSPPIELQWCQLDYDVPEEAVLFLTSNATKSIQRVALSVPAPISIPNPVSPRQMHKVELRPSKRELIRLEQSQKKQQQQQPKN